MSETDEGGRTNIGGEEEPFMIAAGRAAVGGDGGGAEGKRTRDMDNGIEIA